MKYFTLGSMMAMVALSFSLAQPAQAYLFGLSNGNPNNILTLTYQDNSEVGLLWSDGGWYSGAIHLSSTTNYIVAQPGDSDIPNVDPGIPNEAYRNYFVFNIPVSDIPITKAILDVYSYGVTTTETYRLFDVTTPIHTLIDEKDEFGNQVSEDVLRSTFDDLGSGRDYGSYLYDLGDAYKLQPRTLTLNPNFVADLNLAIDKRNAINNAADPNDLKSKDFIVRYAIGGTVETPSTVPEPSSLLLLGAGLLGLAAWRWKHAA